MLSKMVLAIPLALLLFAGMHHVDGDGQNSSTAMIAHAQGLDITVCEDDCRFRYNIKMDRCGNPILPTDTPRRIGYEKCLAECQRRSTGGDDNP
ncbi:MAG: hypothetical protein P8182_17400 [Deltaproteobacteria bacterium]